MQTLTIGAAQYTLAPTRNVGELSAKIAKCTGKHKPAKIAKPRRNYPTFKPGMSTAEYVALYDAANGSHYVAGYFAPLNTAPCALYDGADTHEELTDAELSQDAAPVECEPVPDVAAEVAAPIADPVSCADDVAELTARLLAAVERPTIAPTIAAHATPATHSEPAPARPVYASDHRAWMDVENGRAEPDEYQARVIECFGEVKAGGLFYNSDTYPATAALMTARYGYPDWRGDRGQSDGVANPFGMDCYRANSVIRARAERERERGAAATFTVGQRFARLIFNDGKQRTAAELVTLDPAGFACKLKAKSGRNSVEVTCSAYALSLAVIRAEERGKVLAAKRASARPEPIAPMPAEPAPVPSKSEPETLMLSHVLGALQCIAPDGIPDAAMLAREADRIEATAARMRDAMPDYSATCATVARDLRTLADSAIDPLPGKSEPAADPFDAWQAAPNDPKPTFGAYSYAKRTGRTVVAYCGGGRIQSCAKAAGMRYVHRVKGFVGTPRQAEKMRAAWLAGAMRNAERAKDGVAEPGSLRAMLESLAVPTHTPLPGDTKPEALDDDETIPAPLDGLDVAELDDMVEFERAGGIAQPIAPAYRDDAPRATPTPSLRISPSDPRARIPARFAPVYLLQA